VANGINDRRCKTRDFQQQTFAQAPRKLALMKCKIIDTM